MPKGTNQKLKLLYLQKVLLEETDYEHGLTMEQIIKCLEAYEVTAERKTLYADLKALKEVGMDIVGEKCGKEYRYHVQSRDFELAEVKILADALSASRFISKKKTKELIEKISHLVSKYEAKSLRRQVYLSGRVKATNESVYYTVDAVHRAIAAKRKVRFIYTNWNTKKKLVPRYNGKVYEVSPWGLSFNDDNYYMIGFDSDRQTIRHYRLDKMKDIALTDIPVDGADYMRNIEIGTYVTQNFGMCGGDVRAVRVRLPETFCGVFIDRFGKDIEFHDVGDGMVECTITLAVSWTFFAWIFGLGDVTIVAPQDVVREVKEFIGDIVQKYR